MRLSGLLGLCALFVLGGCFYVDSSDSPPPDVSHKSPRTVGPLLTTGAREVGAMQASMSVQSDGKDIKVYAALLNDTEFLTTDDGDYFTARIGAETAVLTREPSVGNVIHYTASFPVAQGPVDVVIAFVRRNGKTGAPYSTVRLPAPFTITSAPDHISKTEPVKVTTSAAFVMATVELEGPCIQKLGAQLVGGDKEISFDPSVIVRTAESCTLQVNVRHWAKGQLDSAFRNGLAIEGLQVRSFNAKLLPQ